MIVIVGGGLAGLVAAHALATAGKEVTLLEARSKLGGLVASEEIGEVRFDIGAESYARRATEVADYLRGLGLETVLPAGRSWIWNGSPIQIPANTSLGIPADPSSDEIAAIIADTERIKEDLVLDPSIGAEATTLAELVEARMGTELLEKLVRPIAGAIYSTDPANLSINPKLKADFLETGSLAKAVAKGLSGPAVASVDGGMFRLVDALAEQAEEAGAELVTGARVNSLDLTESGASVTAEIDGTSIAIDAAHIILATDIRSSQFLLEQVMVLEPFEIPQGKPTTHVSLVLDAPELDEAPRGSGLLCVQGTSRAKALTHLSSKWPWLRGVTDFHAIRVSYALNEDLSTEQALQDANQLLGTQIDPEAIVGARVVCWGDALTPSTPALRSWAEAITPPKQITVTGAWRAGTGIAAVIPHALASAQSLVD